jgi:hypothetical protein
MLFGLPNGRLPIRLIDDDDDNNPNSIFMSSLNVFTILISFLTLKLIKLNIKEVQWQKKKLKNSTDKVGTGMLVLSHIMFTEPKQGHIK